MLSVDGSVSQTLVLILSHEHCTDDIAMIVALTELQWIQQCILHCTGSSGSERETITYLILPFHSSKLCFGDELCWQRGCWMEYLFKNHGRKLMLFPWRITWNINWVFRFCVPKNVGVESWEQIMKFSHFPIKFTRLQPSVAGFLNPIKGNCTINSLFWGVKHSSDYKSVENHATLVWLSSLSRLPQSGSQILLCWAIMSFTYHTLFS